MQQLPFGEDVTPTTGRRSDRPLMVAEAAALVRRALADSLPAKLRVAGEISNFTDRSHWFFSLKDDNATLRCVCFASAARRIRFQPADGQAVVATGRIDYYDAQGSVQLYVEKLEPVGEGALEQRFRALCQTLRDLGYFEVQRKKPLPPVVRRVAVVTSASGAALQDVIHTARQRWAGCRLFLFDVLVQGDQAAPRISKAIRTLSKGGSQLDIDAIILTRGGGSIEDLWAFNEREVADAIFHCRLPVVAAIGHETDTTIAEMVADQRCATPTQAAMTLIPDQQALQHQLTQLSQRMRLLTERRIESARQRLRAVTRHPAFSRPQQMLLPVRQRLESLCHRLHTAAPHQVIRARQRLEGLCRQLEAVGPRNVLQRGYSYTLGPDGGVLRRAETVGSGDRITTVLSHGKLRSVVEGRVGRKGSKGKGQQNQPGLF